MKMWVQGIVYTVCKVFSTWEDKKVSFSQVSIQLFYAVMIDFREISCEHSLSMRASLWGFDKLIQN